MENMDNKIKEQQINKYQNLLQAAQTELDSARVSEAPASTIQSLEQRVEALKETLKKWENFGIEVKTEETNTANATSSKKGGKKDKKTEVM